MSQVPVEFDRSATCEYVRVLQQHVIQPLEATALSESCFAAAMLVFGAVDGLGRLIHPDPAAGPGSRFKHFLPRLGADYATLQEELWALRNSLAHNAMNVACFMSKTENARGQHLEQDRGFVFVHTRRLLEDFKSTVDRLVADFRSDPGLLERAESRLEWDSIVEPSWRGVMTTPPPDLRFIRFVRSR